MPTLLALALVACTPRPVPPAEPPVPPYEWPDPPPPPIPSGLEGRALAVLQGSLAWVDLWGDDAVAVAEDAVALGLAPRTAAVPEPDVDPEVARWAATLLGGRTRVRLFAPEEAGLATVAGRPAALVAAVPALADDGALGLRLWFEPIGAAAPVGPWAVVHLGEDPAEVTLSRGATDTCEALGVTPLPVYGQHATCGPAEGCPLRCSAVDLPDGARLVATEWPPADSGEACVSAAVRYAHGGIAAFDTTCRAVEPELGPALRAGTHDTSLPVGWIGEPELFVVDRLVGWRRDRCLAHRPEVGAPLEPVACTAGPPSPR